VEVGSSRGGIMGGQADRLRRPEKWKDKQEVKINGDEAFLKLWQAISDGTIAKLVS
jgi:hypothetical protein